MQSSFPCSFICRMEINFKIDDAIADAIITTPELTTREGPKGTYEIVDIVTREFKSDKSKKFLVITAKDSDGKKYVFNSFSVGHFIVSSKGDGRMRDVLSKDTDQSLFFNKTFEIESSKGVKDSEDKSIYPYYCYEGWSAYSTAIKNGGDKAVAVGVLKQTAIKETHKDYFFRDITIKEMIIEARDNNK